MTGHPASPEVFDIVVAPVGRDAEAGVNADGRGQFPGRVVVVALLIVVAMLIVAAALSSQLGTHRQSASLTSGTTAPAPSVAPIPTPAPPPPLCPPARTCTYVNNPDLGAFASAVGTLPSVAFGVRTLVTDRRTGAVLAERVTGASASVRIILTAAHVGSYVELPSEMDLTVMPAPQRGTILVSVSRWQFRADLEAIGSTPLPIDDVERLLIRVAIASS